jgi:hypothetical protein
MPIKERESSHAWTFRVHGKSEAGDSFDNHADWKIVTGKEKITYTNSGIGVWYNYCLHTFFTWGGFSGNLTHQNHYHESPAELTTNAPISHFANARVGGLPYAHRLVDLVANFDRDLELNHRAVRTMIPKIPRYLSIANFLYELREFAKMFVFWKLRMRLLTQIANGILNVKYGWKPFLMDVVSLLKGLAEFRKALKRFASEQHKVHVRHYKKLLTNPQGFPRFIPARLDDDGVIYEVPMWITPDQGGPGLSEGVNMLVESVGTSHFIQPPHYFATMKYTYHCPQLLERLGELKAFLDAFNIYWDPQIIWDAIPFSFVVDWFFRVGDWLHANFAKPNLDVLLRIIDFCASTKAEVIYNAVLTIASEATDPHALEPTTNLVQFKYSDSARRYCRIPQNPVLVDPTGLLDPIPDLQRVVVALALGHNVSQKGG